MNGVTNKLPLLQLEHSIRRLLQGHSLTSTTLHYYFVGLKLHPQGPDLPNCWLYFNISLCRSLELIWLGDDRLPCTAPDDIIWFSGHKAVTLVWYGICVQLYHGSWVLHCLWSLEGRKTNPVAYRVKKPPPKWFFYQKSAPVNRVCVSSFGHTR
jgi:hypothetical protein